MGRTKNNMPLRFHALWLNLITDRTNTVIQHLVMIPRQETGYQQGLGSQHQPPQLASVSVRGIVHLVSLSHACGA